MKIGLTILSRKTVPRALRNSRGQSLVQTIVSAAIVGIIMMAFAQMMTNQTREVSSLQQRLAAMDLEKLLIASLANGGVCQYVLNNPVQTFNAQSVTSGVPQTLNLVGPGSTPATLYTNIKATTPPSPGAVAAQVGAVASALSSTLKVQSIQLQILSGGSGTYSANWIINFDESKLVRSIHPLTVSTFLTVNDTSSPTAATVTGCQGTGPVTPPPTVPGTITGGGYCLPWYYNACTSWTYWGAMEAPGVCTQAGTYPIVSGMAGAGPDGFLCITE